MISGIGWDDPFGEDHEAQERARRRAERESRRRDREEADRAQAERDQEAQRQRAEREARSRERRAALALRIQRASQPPRLEWFLDNSPGSDSVRGVPIDGFRQRKPGDGTKVSQPTTAYLSYDNDHL